MKKRAGLQSETLIISAWNLLSVEALNTVSCEKCSQFHFHIKLVDQLHHDELFSLLQILFSNYQSDLVDVEMLLSRFSLQSLPMHIMSKRVNLVSTQHLSDFFIRCFSEGIVSFNSTNFKEISSEQLVTRSHWRSEIPLPEYAQTYVRTLCKPFKHAQREEACKESKLKLWWIVGICHLSESAKQGRISTTGEINPSPQRRECLR